MNLAVCKACHWHTRQGFFTIWLMFKPQMIALLKGAHASSIAPIGTCVLLLPLLPLLLLLLPYLSTVPKNPELTTDMPPSLHCRLCRRTSLATMAADLKMQNDLANPLTDNSFFSSGHALFNLVQRSVKKCALPIQRYSLNSKVYS